MKLSRLANAPSALIDFFEEGLGALGAICERTWHDRLHVLAEGTAAHLWRTDGQLLEKEIRFIPPDDSAPRQADNEVFPGCPLTFRLTESLLPRPLQIERARLQPVESPKPPTVEVAERLWHSQYPGCLRWKLQSNLMVDWHFSLVALARCEIQAIDQHWSLHRITISLPDGQPDETLASALDFVQLSSAPDAIPWPPGKLGEWRDFLKRAAELELAPDLRQVRERQQRYLRRELERIGAYFQGYKKEIEERQRRAHSDPTRLKAQERLAAAKDEHAHRRQDQIHRHEIRVIMHLDALLLLAEPAFQTRVSFIHKGETKVVPAEFVPRSRRWALGDSITL